MEQYKDIISELEELKKTKYINLIDLKQIDSILTTMVIIYQMKNTNFIGNIRKVYNYELY